MLFPTLEFALFFLITFAVAWALRGTTTLRLAFLTVASYVFYGWWDWRFTALLFASSSFNWLFGRLIYESTDPVRSARLTAIAVTGNLAVLAGFKYFDFFVGSANAGLAALGIERGLPYLDVVLPIGISFFTFHGISYVVDLKRGALTLPATFLQMLLYISFFPQLVAGPIVRAAHFLPQLARPVDPDDIRVTRAFLLILGGLFKKVVVANYLASDLVDNAFFDPSRHSALELLLAAYGYAIQIYCDFSAYTDIAIGIAALFGYRFPQNFDQPYRSARLREFWRRWHMSLSFWLRDYLYIPLGGNEGGWKRYRNLMITMLLGGLWHGAAWTFVLWGALHGAALVIEHLMAPEAPKSRLARALGVLITFHFVCLTWIFFRSSDLDHALAYLAGLVNFSATTVLPSPFALCLIAGGMAAQFLPAQRMAWLEGRVRWMPLALQGALVGAAIVAIDALGPTGVAPFIYFRF